jgi:hypothetical protein
MYQHYLVRIPGKTGNVIGLGAPGGETSHRRQGTIKDPTQQRPSDLAQLNCWRA